MKNFTLSLYAFHLARTFDDPSDRATETGAESFGQELQAKLATQINLPYQLITLLLHDTYFTDLTFSAPESALDFTPDRLEQLQPSALLPENINTSIGQTIGIYGEVASKQEANQDLADDYVRNLLKDTPYKNHLITASNHSNLLGIPLFEYFCKATQSDQNPKTVCHIWVLLNYQGTNSLEKLSIHYRDIVNLLCSYHKIKLVYQQAELSYQAALKAAQKIEKEITEFGNYVSNKTQNLDNFSTMLDKLPLLALQHSNYCGELELARTTMEINHQIYQEYLQKLLAAGSELDSWHKFSNQTRDVLLKQIQFWLNYMTPRKELGQQLTASIRGIVEIEQAKIDRQRQEQEKDSDRQLQTVVAVVGVGIGASGVAATVSPYTFAIQPDQEELTLIPVHFQPDFGLNPPHHLTLSLLFSLVAGLVGVVIASRAIRHIQKHKNGTIAYAFNYILDRSKNKKRPKPNQS